jgi:hypothetical protein
LKDVDYENLVMRELLQINISEEDARLIIMTLERDIAFMKKNGLMDYSLLLGIEKINKFEIFMPGNNNLIKQKKKGD